MDSHGNKPAQPDAGTAANRGKKKAYRTPRLTEYGSVAKLTQSNAGSGADGGKRAGQMKACL